MFKLGNVVSPDQLINHKQVEYLNYFKSIDDVNNKLPTLVIGWAYYKTISQRLGIEADILNKMMINQMYWEFSPSEDIIQYTQGLENYVKKVPNYYTSKFTYLNVDPFFNNLFTIDHLDRYFPQGGDLYVYKNDMIYYRKGFQIFGLKLSIFEYLNQNIGEIIELFQKKSKNTCLDVDSLEYQKFYKLFPEFGLLKRNMVVFLFP